MTHRNLTSTSLNDISDKPEKDQVSFGFRLRLVMCMVRSWMLGKGAPTIKLKQKKRASKVSTVFPSPVTGSSTFEAPALENSRLNSCKA